jgi:type IV pilus assembly protein PilV
MVSTTRELSNPGTREGGFTLLETLVAMTLFAIGILGLTQVQFAASRNTMMSKQTSTASFLASDRLEEMVHGASFAGITEAAYPEEDYGDVAGGDERYTRFKRTVAVRDSTDIAGRIAMKTVTVQVSWEALRGERHVDLTSRVARF